MIFEPPQLSKHGFKVPERCATAQCSNIASLLGPGGAAELRTFIWTLLEEVGLGGGLLRMFGRSFFFLAWFCLLVGFDVPVDFSSRIFYVFRLVVGLFLLRVGSVLVHFFSLSCASSIFDRFFAGVSLSVWFWERLLLSGLLAYLFVHLVLSFFLFCFFCAYWWLLCVSMHTPCAAVSFLIRLLFLLLLLLLSLLLLLLLLSFFFFFSTRGIPLNIGNLK